MTIEQHQIALFMAARGNFGPALRLHGIVAPLNMPQSHEYHDGVDVSMFGGISPAAEYRQHAERRREINEKMEDETA